jgi:hypothetical protein
MALLRQALRTVCRSTGLPLRRGRELGKRGAAARVLKLGKRERKKIARTASKVAALKRSKAAAARTNAIGGRHLSTLRPVSLDGYRHTADSAVSSAFNLEIPPFFNLDTFNVFPDV